jgi:molecular chaperone DnaJ
MSSVQREWFEKNYYEVLGVAANANAKDITKAYRSLARQFHPDTNPDNPIAEERFKEISAAYDVLGDEKKRSEYDEVRRLAPGGAAGGGGGGRSGGLGDTFASEDLGDLFDNLFGGGTARAYGPRRGNDLMAAMTISFEDAIRGMTTTITVDQMVVCGSCHGSGAAPGTFAQTCINCNGTGTSNKEQGFFSFATPCVSCGGRGSVIVTPCQSCAGRGVLDQPKNVQVRIPAGVDNEQKIRLKGMGEQGKHGGASGDLYIEVTVHPHPWFDRAGNDIKIKVPVTFSEAVLGSTVQVPLPLGGSVGMKVPAGTGNGKTLRVKGKGIETGKATGDLLVEIDVVVPSSLSENQRRLVEELGETFTESPRKMFNLN